ncbi:FecR domain-containing protein [Chloroflexota bacterium]
MNSRLSKALDECITRMNHGEPLEQCLADHSEIEDELRELLSLLTLISTTPKVVPSEGYRRTSKARVMARIKQEASSQRVHGSDTKDKKNSIWQTIMRPKRIMVPISISLAVLVVVSLIASGVINLWSPIPVLAHPCTLSTLSGNVERKAKASDGWTAGIDGTVLKTGDYVRTDEHSHALLTFFDGSTVKLEPESTVEIVEVEYDRQQNTNIVVRQLGGVIWNHIEAPLAGRFQFRVNTPSAEVSALGTSFTVDVSESGSTKVIAVEGNVGVRAQGREVQLLANQETSVEVGSKPAMPSMHVKEEDQLLITLDLPGVCSVKDPNGSSTGYLPSGISFNQIKESQLELSDDGKQLISVSNPKSGEYLLTIRNTQYQSAKLNIRAVSQDKVIFEHSEVVKGTDDDQILRLSISEDNAKIISAEIAKIEPIIGQGPEKVVVTDISIERALSVKAIIEALKDNKISGDDGQVPSQPRDSTEDKAPVDDDVLEDSSRNGDNDDVKDDQEDIIDNDTSDKDKISIDNNEALDDLTRDIQESTVDEDTSDKDKISIDAKESDDSISTRDTQEDTADGNADVNRDQISKDIDGDDSETTREVQEDVAGEDVSDEDEISTNTNEDSGDLSIDIQEGIVDEENDAKDKTNIDSDEDDRVAVGDGQGGEADEITDDKDEITIENVNPERSESLKLLGIG